jgi:hypothetical protein
VIIRDGFADGKTQFAKVVGVKRPAHRENDFMVLKEIRQLAAGRPHLSDVGLELNQFLLDGSEFIVRQIVEMRRVGLVVAQNLRGHVNGREVIPHGDFSFVFRIPKNRPGVGRLRENGRVIQKRIRAPHKRDPIDLAIGFDKREVTKSGRELRVRREFRKVERSGESGARDGRGDVA